MPCNARSLECWRAHVCNEVEGRPHGRCCWRAGRPAQQKSMQQAVEGPKHGPSQVTGQIKASVEGRPASKKQ